MLGLAERGHPSDGTWSWHTGPGHVAATDGQYRRAINVGCVVAPLLFETFGGFSPEVERLLKGLAVERDNRLTAAEYDATTWSARSWKAFATQQLSVSLHYSAALEIASALGLATA